MPEALVVEDLNVHYGVVRAVQNLSLRVPAGQVVALVGANGAGKSSTLNAIAGVISSQATSVRANGVEIFTTSPEGLHKPPYRV